MSVLIVPVDGTVPYYDQIVQLENLEYLLSFKWSQRGSCWYLQILDQDENPLAMGIKLVSNVDLLRRFISNPALPPGKLVCVPIGPGGDMVQQSDLGTAMNLIYVTSDDEALAS